MASQKDVQDLLRMMTTGRNKVSMMAAMKTIKDLQSVGIKRVNDIASSDLPTLVKAVGDDKSAKQLLAAAKKEINPSKKRNASDSASSPEIKRRKSAYELDNEEPQTPQALEASLALPTPSENIEEMSKATVKTNRAPLMLSFALSLLKYTMPDQPLSSRLSLAQAVTSLNARSKAVSLGITKGEAAAEGWGQGQPKVVVMGREVYVLKRGGYSVSEPKPSEEAGSEGHITSVPIKSEEEPKIEESNSTTEQFSSEWSVSQSVTSRQSTFVARSRQIKSRSHARELLKQLMESKPELREATHTVTAWRVQNDQGGIIEECDDDGETGGGRHVLQILKESDVVGHMIVMSRWFGGIMLGTDRWRIMTQVCRDALSQRLRIAGNIGQEALWGLDLEGQKETDGPVTGGRAAGMQIHRPETARLYLLKSFPLNLQLLLGALDLLFQSWTDHMSHEELDRKAWLWYVQVRPQTAWGEKGDVKLEDLLNLCRNNERQG